MQIIMKLNPCYNLATVLLSSQKILILKIWKCGSPNVCFINKLCNLWLNIKYGSKIQCYSKSMVHWLFAFHICIPYFYSFLVMHIYGMQINYDNASRRACKTFVNMAWLSSYWAELNELKCMKQLFYCQ